METYFTILSETSPPGETLGCNASNFPNLKLTSVMIGLCLARFAESLGEKKNLFGRKEDEWNKAFDEAREEEQLRLELARRSAPGVSPPGAFTAATQTRFRPIRKLGMGSFGHVYEVEQEGTRERFAQKFIPEERKSTTRRALKEQVSKEISAMQKLRHHHIVTLAFHIEDDEGFKLMMQPVADSNLAMYLLDCIAQDYPRSKIRMLDNWFGCLVTALTFAHNNSVIHEDLKLANILIKDDRVYLADFGCARDFENSQSSVSTDQAVRGTIDYWPPEPGTTRGRAADVFALGCVFSEIFTVRHRRSLDDYQEHRKSDARDHPYAFSKNLDAVRSWLQLLLVPSEGLNLNDGTSADPRDQKIMSASADERAAVTHLLLEVTLKMLELDPGGRGDAKKLKKMLRGEDEVLFCGNCL